MALVEATRRLPSFILNMDGYSLDDKHRIAHAYEFSRTKHKGQKRRSGEPYIIHPIAVVTLLSAWHVDTETLIAGMLHDTLEDTQTTQQELVIEFGSTCAQLVEGVTKIGNIKVNPGARREASTENVRKLLLAMSRDIRVVLVKLADRLHNMRTIEYLPTAKQRRKAQETLDIFAPLADRLGMGDVKAELEDLAFAVLEPRQYADLKRLAAPKIRSGKRFLNRVSHDIAADCQADGLEPEIEYRIKHIYSLYKKLGKYDQDFSRVRDLVAVRVIVVDIAQCYQVLGLVHQRYKPLPQYIKDYIAVPKPNGYQSLHTTVLGDRHIFEVQIRSQAMHDFAEHGLAAHFYYDERKSDDSYREGGKNLVPKKLEWVQNLLDWQDDMTSEYDTRQALQLDVFSQRIFVFSPGGDLFDLPEGATPIDFAFQLHTQLGLTCRGAKVNGRMVPLDYRLSNRDVVEVFAFRDTPRPSRDWLSFVVTAKARSRLRVWFKAQNQSSEEQEGRVMLEEALRQAKRRPWHQLSAEGRRIVLKKLSMTDEAELFIALSHGRLQPKDVMRELLYGRARTRSTLLGNLLRKQTKARPVALIPGIDREHVSRAGCCSPIYPEKIVGYIPRQGGCRIHRETCRQIETQPERRVPAYWYFDSSDRIRLQGSAQQTAVILRGVSHHLHGFDARAGQILESNPEPGTVQFDILLSLVRMDRLQSLLRALGRVPGVTKVEHSLR